MMDWPREVKVGEECAWALYVVNDYQRGYENLMVEWRIAQDDVALAEGQVEGSVPENSLLEIGEIIWTARSAST